MSRALETAITLRDLEIWTRIGVSGEERGMEQRVLVTVTMEHTGEAGETDRLEDAADYEKVAHDIREVARNEHRTLEKFAEDIAEVVLQQENVRKATVELKKFVLPGTEHAALTITRPVRPNDIPS